MPEGAIFVGRPTKWGNPYRVGAYLDELDYGYRYIYGLDFSLPLKDGRFYIPDNETATRAFARWTNWTNWGYALKTSAVRELRGHDLACWCAIYNSQGLRIPCHADVLLRLANP